MGNFRPHDSHELKLFSIKYVRWYLSPSHTSARQREREKVLKNELLRKKSCPCPLRPPHLMQHEFFVRVEHTAMLLGRLNGSNYEPATKKKTNVHFPFLS